MAELVEDLKRRRADMASPDRSAAGQVITAMVPLGTMLGYAPTLERLSQGRASFAMRLNYYAPVSPPGDTPVRPAMGMRA